MKTLYWYDFETFGADPRRDRASQFAGIRTDEDLNIVGDPLVMYCKPADDFLPNPVACLITGIAPQKAQAEGVSEAEFIRLIQQEFSEPDTCVVGYNSIRFDDEVTRQLLYRNFYDPYEREWKNGNSRWDIIDMVRLCAATRPEGINWPKKEDGSNSFKLDQLTVANGIEHEDAHDALADVVATIEIAKLIKTHQPKLYDFAYGLRGKRQVQVQLNLETKKPALHISMLYPARQGCLSLVMPICIHPTNNNGIIVYDLRTDPASWLDLSVEEIKARLYVPRDQLQEGQTRIPLTTIHINKCPMVTSAAVLDADKAALYKIDLEACKTHWQLLADNPAVHRKIADVFREQFTDTESDPDYMIYSGGFFGENDKSLMKTIRGTKPEDLGRLDMPFRDNRLGQMFFRYRARNYPQTLTKEERERWEEFRLGRIQSLDVRENYEKAMEEAQQKLAYDSSYKKTVLDALAEYVNEISKPYEEPAASKE